MCYNIPISQIRSHLLKVLIILIILSASSCRNYYEIAHDKNTPSANNTDLNTFPSVDPVSETQITTQPNNNRPVPVTGSVLIDSPTTVKTPDPIVLPDSLIINQIDESTGAASVNAHDVIMEDVTVDLDDVESDTVSINSNTHFRGLVIIYQGEQDDVSVENNDNEDHYTVYFNSSVIKVKKRVDK
jgi:hypothetical protein